MNDKLMEYGSLLTVIFSGISVLILSFFYFSLDVTLFNKLKFNIWIFIFDVCKNGFYLFNTIKQIR